jgi:cytochrome c oxidase cbb3-type subunit 3
VRARGGEASESETARVIQSLAVRYAALLIFTIAVSHAQTTPRSAGRRTFESSCASCHGLNGRGGEHAPDIATRPEIMKLPDSGILKLLREGRPQAGMPPFAGLGAAKLSDLVHYLRVLQGQRGSPTLLGSAEKGKEVFSGKGGCSECHMVHGLGGFLGPDLSDYGVSHSAADIRHAIVSAEKRPAIRKGLVKATTKDGRQISGVVRNEDNFSVQLQARDGAFYSLDKADLSELMFDSEPLMPDKYGSTLSKSELDQVVSYLLNVAEAKQNRPVVTSR